MEKSSYQINWKWIGIRVLIAMTIFFFILFLGWYFLGYRPEQQLLEDSRKLDESLREFYIHKGLPLPEYFQYLQ